MWSTWVTAKWLECSQQFIPGIILWLFFSYTQKTHHTLVLFLYHHCFKSQTTGLRHHAVLEKKEGPGFLLRIHFRVEQSLGWNGIPESHGPDGILAHQHRGEVEGDAFPVPAHHGLVWIEGDSGRCLCVGGDKLQGSFEEDLAGVNGVGGAGLGAGGPGPSRHCRRLVAPVPVHSDQDVIGQGVEMDPCQVWGPLRCPAVLLQDPEEDVTDHPHIRNAAPGGQGGVGTRGSLGEEQQLLLIQPDGVHQGKDLLTGTGNSKVCLQSWDSSPRCGFCSTLLLTQQKQHPVSQSLHFHKLARIT